jgi:hypothetical protein
VVDASEADAASIAAIDHEPVAAGTSRWIVVNKIDLIDDEAKHKLAAALLGAHDVHHLPPRPVRAASNSSARSRASRINVSRPSPRWSLASGSTRRSRM